MIFNANTAVWIAESKPKTLLFMEIFCFLFLDESEHSIKRSGVCVFCCCCFFDVHINKLQF